MTDRAYFNVTFTLIVVSRHMPDCAEPCQTTHLVIASLSSCSKTSKDIFQALPALVRIATIVSEMRSDKLLQAGAHLG
jgi:hypothetical protein